MRRMLTLILTTALASAALLCALKARRAEAQSENGDARRVRGEAASDEHAPRTLRPAHTFSIVARDPETGELGVAVQSHWFSVGSNVAWAEAGVRAVATQSFIDPSYGRDGLDLMRAGKGAGEALSLLLDKDEGRAVRQVAMID